MELITCIITVLATLIGIAVTYIFSRRATVKQISDNKKSEVYVEFLELLYEVRTCRSLNLDYEYINRCIGVRAKLKLYANDEIRECVSEFFDELNKAYNGFLSEREPQSEEEYETLYEKYSFDDEWIIQYIDTTSDKMRTELKVK